MRPFFILLALMTCTWISAPLCADILNIGGEPQVVTRSDLPPRGMRQSAVLARYGEPKSRKPAVGKPPISSWDYDEFVIYFEYDRVVHTVVRQR